MKQALGYLPENGYCASLAESHPDAQANSIHIFIFKKFAYLFERQRRKDLFVYLKGREKTIFHLCLTPQLTKQSGLKRPKPEPGIPTGHACVTGA